MYTKTDKSLKLVCMTDRAMSIQACHTCESPARRACAHDACPCVLRPAPLWIASQATLHARYSSCSLRCTRNVGIHSSSKRTQEGRTQVAGPRPEGAAPSSCSSCAMRERHMRRCHCARATRCEWLRIREEGVQLAQRRKTGAHVYGGGSGRGRCHRRRALRRGGQSCVGRWQRWWQRG